MDYRTAYIRRSRKGSRLKKRVAAIGLLGVAACAVVFALEMRESAAPPAMQAQAQAPAADTATPAPVVLRTAAQAETKKTRRVYPYSIVPGGVIDRRELAHAVVADKVVAAHYAAFETARATVETVTKPRAVYVSYRKGDKVFWTSKKLQLARRRNPADRRPERNPHALRQPHFRRAAIARRGKGPERGRTRRVRRAGPGRRRQRGAGGIRARR
ncbi:hypothetical protein [Massilia phosphatilytica]